MPGRLAWQLGGDGRQSIAVELDDPHAVVLPAAAPWCVDPAGPQRDLYETVRLAMHEKVRREVAAKGLARSHIIVLDALLNGFPSDQSRSASRRAVHSLSLAVKSRRAWAGLVEGRAR